MDVSKFVGKSNQAKGLVLKLLRDVESGFFSAPQAFDTITRYRTEELSFKGPHQPLRVDLPERQLLKEFVRKYPEARSEPFALDSFRPPLSRQFVQRQQQLMLAGSDREAAFAETEAVFADQLKQMRKRHLESVGGLDPLELLQRQEQEQLDAGLTALQQQRKLEAEAAAQQ